MSVRVRYAPSPTGLQHIGGVRSALFNYFFAKSQKGKFILRVEDTDQSRSTDESLEDLYQTLSWLSMDWDEGPVVGGPFAPYIQSERFELYKKYAQKLVDDGKAYYCYCSSERLEKLREEQVQSKSKVQGYDGHCEHISDEEREEKIKAGVKPVIRLKVPKTGKTSFDDLIMGKITRKNSDISPDPILLKSDGFPTYHLANVIDDHMMEITHILRAQEWIPSGPLHIILYEAFGWEPPKYVHLPMVMGSDGQKLSKRHGSTSLRDFRLAGYLPQAIINYVSLVGWAYDGEREIFSKKELEELFDINKIHKSPGVFDYKKLLWFNGYYIRETEDDKLVELLIPFLQRDKLVDTPISNEDLQILKNSIPLIKDRLKLLSDVSTLLGFVYKKEMPEIDLEVFIAKKSSKEIVQKVLKEALEIFSKDYNEESLNNTLKDLALSLNVKVNEVMQPIRVALTYSTISPPLYGSIELIGKEEAKNRINIAFKRISKW